MRQKIVKNPATKVIRNTVVKEYKRRGFAYVTLRKGVGGSGNTIYVVQYATTARPKLHQSEQFQTKAEAESYIKHALQSKKNPAKSEADEIAAHKLYLYMTTDSRFTAMRESVYKNLITKQKRGTYDSRKAPIAFMPVVERAARAYAKEFGNANEWADIFSKSTRYETAKQLAEFFEAEATTGNYDRFLPKKYQNGKDTKEIEKLKEQIFHIKRRLRTKDYNSDEARRWIEVGLALAELQLKQAQEIRKQERRRNPREVENVSMGYFDGSGFHPIRASHDYDEDRTDEHYHKRPVRKYAKKEKAFKASRRNPMKAQYVVRWWNDAILEKGYDSKRRSFDKKSDAIKFWNELVKSDKSTFGGVWDILYGGYIKEKTRRNSSVENPQKVSYAGQNSFALHKIVIGKSKYSAYYDENGNLKDAERIDSRGRSYSVSSEPTLQKLRRLGKVYKDDKGEVRERSNPNINSSEIFNADKIDKLSATFQGHINGKQIETVGSDYTPPLTARLGKLALIVLKNGKDVYEIKFNGNAWLSADARKNLYAEGKEARIKNAKLPRKGTLTYLGEVQQVNYRTNKSHIENGELVEYYHELGEVDKIRPNAFLDHDGFIIFNGGNYDIDIHGIEN
jgi:hypothetical protein